MPGDGLEDRREVPARRGHDRHHVGQALDIVGTSTVVPQDSPVLASPRRCRADQIAAIWSDPHVSIGEHVEGPTDTGVRASVIDDDQLGENTAVPEANPSRTANVGYCLLQTGGRETTLDLIASRKRDRGPHQHALVRCHHQPSSRERPCGSSVHTELIQARKETGVAVLGKREHREPLGGLSSPRLARVRAKPGYI
jgi:hypothetical protein